MKTKEKQATKSILRCLYLRAFAICILTVLFILPTAATEEAQEDFLVENYNLTERYLSLLGEDASYYSSIDSDPQRTVSTSVVAAINLYRKQILDLQSHPDAATRSLEKEIRLAYSKGRAAGRASWIYFYQSARLSLEDSLAKVGACYEEQLSAIHSAKEPAVLDAEADVLCEGLNIALYRQLLLELAQEDDSLASSSIIAGGIDALATISDFSLFGDSYELLYSQTKDALMLSRATDKTSAELYSLFAIIRKGEDHLSDPTVALFTYKQKNAKDLKSINDALSEALCTLLAVDESKLYTRLYTAGLCENINADCLSANKKGEVLSVAHLFEDYTEERRRAEAKDCIRSDIYEGGRSDGILDALESEFNSEGGRIDKCATETEIDSELIRARYMLGCYEGYRTACEEIEIALEPYEKQGELSLAEAIYTDGTNALRRIAACPEFEKLCAKEESECLKKLKDTVTNAKAERFLLDHAAIISKPSAELCASDEIYLRHALDDYTRLEPSVAQLLISQINSIVEKYNSVLSMVIRSKLPDDALFLDLCELFCKELSNTPRTNIAEYYNICDMILSKAQALSETVIYYRELCGEELYASYSSAEREDLADVCRDHTEALHKLDVKDKGIFSDELADLCRDAKIDLWRINERVRVRAGARGSSNPEIKAIVLETNSRINASRDTSEISAIASKAIFKIERILTADAIVSSGNALRLSIERMKYLSEGERERLIGTVSSLVEQASPDALVSENLTVLSFVWSNFSSSLKKAEESARQSDLSLARESYVEKLDNESKKAIDSIRSMTHLPVEKCEEYLNRIVKLRSSFKSASDLSQSSEEVEQAYAVALDTLCSVEISADGDNLGVYRQKSIEKLEGLRGFPERYSTENYNILLEIIEEVRAELSAAGSMSACDSLLEDAKKRIALINDRLDDSIDKALAALESKMELYRSRTDLYSPSALAQLEQIFSEAKKSIEAYTELSRIPDVERKTEQTLRKLSEVRCDYATTLPEGAVGLHPDAAYPSGYDLSSRLWGVLYSEGAVPSDAILSITLLETVDLRDARSLIRKAAKRGELITFGDAPSDELLKKLKRSKVALALDISLSSAVPLSQSANLTLLIPDELAEENILGIVFINDDNDVEFYNIEKDKSLISLDLSHFSSYYIVVENTINLMPLIIFLAILITLEFILLIFILILRFNRRRKENDRMLPMLSPCFAPPLVSFALARIKPTGAVAVTVLLTVAALSLGCAVAMLARLELSEYRGRNKKTHSSAPAPSQQLLRAPSRNALPERRAFLNAAPDLSDGDEGYYSEGSAVATEEREYPEDKLESLLIPEEEDAAYTCFGKTRHKAEINLDVIEQKFEDGDLVTLDALKRKKLVPKRTDYVKVLARGALTKPLIVEANDFSRAAEEMLVALGGEAIRVRH